MSLDRTDIRTALAAVTYCRHAHILSKRPVPEAADRLAANLRALMSADGHEQVVPQPNWLTADDAAIRLNICPRHARRIAPNIGGQKVNGRWWIPESSLPED